jgi:sterol desaturase/sphingolipid hydroxylase (fatty acid hydroxylase superfamily)
MAFDPVTVTEVPPQSAAAPPRSLGSLRAHTYWRTAAVVGTWLIFTLACSLVLWFGRSPRDLVLAGYDWVGDLLQFLAMVYGTWDFQVLIAMLAIGLALERFIPARRQGVPNGVVNVALGCLMLLFQSAFMPLPGLVGAAVANTIGGAYRLNLGFDTASSLLLAAAAVLMSSILVDFFFYWCHRLQHKSRILWQEHIVHHSDVALNVTTTQRAHFFEFILTPIAVGVPINLLFDLPPPNFVIITLIPVAWAYFVHINIPLGYGRLWWLLTSPQWHRIHHSIEAEHRDKNFALFFPLLDVMFRTAHVPRRGEFPPTGVEGIDVSTLSDAFLFPFVGWYRMATGTADRGGYGGAANRATSGDAS